MPSDLLLPATPALLEDWTGPLGSRTVGSSDVATILGLSPWGNSWDTWCRLRGLTDYDHTDTPAQARGRMLEPALLVRYATDRGVVVEPGPPFPGPGVDGPEPWMHARPDGYATDPTTGDRWLLECKTSKYLSDEHGWGLAGTDQVPLHYLVQCVWQMACCDLDRCDVVAFGTVRDDYRVYPLQRDRRLEVRVVAQVRRWYEHHVVQGHPPRVDDSDACRRAQARMYGRPSSGDRPVLEADDEALGLVEQLRTIRQELDDLDEARRHLEHELMARMGEAGELQTRGGVRLATWRDRSPSRRIDAARLRRELPDIAENYTKMTEGGRSFSLVREDA